MLVENLYTIEHTEIETNTIRASLSINASHEIFKGHFPEVPVLPGVCMVQCIKELIETTFTRKSIIDKADMIKFLSMLNPLESNRLHAEIIIRDKTESQIVFQASLKSEDRFLLKYSGSLLFVK